jgi:hypothetical protein
MIIAVDFDGTCVTHEYPKVGRFIGAQPVLHKLVERGDKLILWTMRDDEELQDAIDWFNTNGIALYGVQTNPSQSDWTSSPKAYANLYIDDAALGAPLVKGMLGERDYIDWEQVEKILFSA